MPHAWTWQCPLSLSNEGMCQIQAGIVPLGLTPAFVCPGLVILKPVCFPVQISSSWPFLPSPPLPASDSSKDVFALKNQPLGDKEAAQPMYTVILHHSARQQVDQSFKHEYLDGLSLKDN